MLYTITQQASSSQTTSVHSVEDHYLTAFEDKPYSAPNPISHSMEMRLVKIHPGFSGSLVRPLQLLCQGATSFLRRLTEAPRRWHNPVVILMLSPSELYSPPQTALLLFSFISFPSLSPSYFFFLSYTH